MDRLQRLCSGDRCELSVRRAKYSAEIRAITQKPIRFAFDTHHHGDHAYGNQVMVDHGATPVAHTGVIEEMKRYETGYYDSKPVGKSRPKRAPTLPRAG